MQVTARHGACLMLGLKSHVDDSGLQEGGTEATGGHFYQGPGLCGVWCLRGALGTSPKSPEVPEGSREGVKRGQSGERGNLASVASVLPWWRQRMGSDTGQEHGVEGSRGSWVQIHIRPRPVETLSSSRTYGRCVTARGPGAMAVAIPVT
jgi:hypothetical protein